MNNAEVTPEERTLLAKYRTEMYAGIAAGITIYVAAAAVVIGLFFQVGWYVVPWVLSVRW